jgi:hypothetical protein
MFREFLDTSPRPTTKEAAAEPPLPPHKLMEKLSMVRRIYQGMFLSSALNRTKDFLRRNDFMCKPTNNGNEKLSTSDAKNGATIARTPQIQKE